MPISDRQRLEHQEWYDQIAAEELAARIEREKPLRESESKFQETAKELALLERDRIIKGLPDPGFTPDPSYDDAKMTFEEAESFNDAQSHLFMATHPEFYQTPENAETLTSYIWSQGVRIVSALTFSRAFERLRSFDLLQERPVEEPEAIEEPAPLSIQHEQYESFRRQPEMVAVFDRDGFAIELPKAEVDRMDANSYRRFLRIPIANKPSESPIPY